ncbi:MAG: hypothetical protein HY855_20770 [Burkholderiales bacterium]|nr:hypothetical protein [Burkholderiales bacterium]
MSRMGKTATVVAGVAGVALVAGVATLVVQAAGTRAEIEAQRQAVLGVAAGPALPRPTPQQLAALPAPVQRFVAYSFPQGVPALTHVDYEMSGQFRRPRTTTFTPTTARQTIAATTPAMVFAATTPIIAGAWATAYDAFVDGRMVMKAKLLSALTVVDEPPTPQLDRISLQRWLLESSVLPVTLLPGGPVRWEAIDAQRARAVVQWRGMQAALVAQFADDGRLLSFATETDGDLRTAYHGSGEHVARDDYRLVDGVRVPMKFTISRAAGGTLYPFWEGRITRLSFGHAGGSVAAGSRTPAAPTTLAAAPTR